MLRRAFGVLPELSGHNLRTAIPEKDYSDIPEWAKSELSDIFSAGIAEGTSDTTFSANAPVTKEELETYCEIPSDNVSFDQRPWMKSAEITDKLIEAIKSGKYDFLRCNYPNGDMVGHTGSMDATVIGVESVDLALARLKEVCDEYGVTLLITADHGNADEMLEKNKKGEIQVRTAHSLNPVPFIIYDKEQKFEIKPSDKYGLANIAPTVVKIFGLEAPECWEDSMI